MNIVLGILTIALLLWGVSGVALFLTRASTTEPGEDFSPFRSFPLMFSTGACMVIVFLVGAFYLLSLLSNGGITMREKALEKRVNYLEAKQQYVPVDAVLYKKVN